MQFNNQNNLYLTSSENKLSNVGFMDVFGTTYFSPPPYITDTLNDINLYLSHRVNNNIIQANENTYNTTNTVVSDNESSNTQVSILSYLLYIYINFILKFCFN